MREAADVEVGGELKQARETAGLTIRALAAFASPDGAVRSGSRFYDAESGRRRASAETVRLYATHCDAPHLMRLVDTQKETRRSAQVVSELFRPAPSAAADDSIIEQATTGATKRHQQRLNGHLTAETPAEHLDFALYLLDSVHDRIASRVFVSQGGVDAAWTQFSDVDRRLFSQALRAAASRGVTITHTVSAEAVRQTDSIELLCRYIEFQRLRGDYNFSQDDRSLVPGFVDSVIRPGIGMLVSLPTTITELSASKGHFFGTDFADYVDDRLIQAEIRAQTRNAPFKVHDPSSVTSSGDRGLRREAALARIELMPGPRVLFKDGLSDLLAPKDVFEATISAITAASSVDVTEWWRYESNNQHAARISGFRANVTRWRHVDFVPEQSLYRYANRGTLAGGSMAILDVEKGLAIDPVLAKKHIRALAQHVASYDNYFLVILKGELADAIDHSGIKLMTKGHSGGSLNNWVLYFESQQGGRDRVSAAFETSDNRYRDALERSLTELADEYTQSYARRDIVDELRKIGQE